MRIPVPHIPVGMMEQYQLGSLIVNGYVIAEIRKGIRYEAYFIPCIYQMSQFSRVVQAYLT